MKNTTKIKLAIEAIEYYQRRFVFEANCFKRLQAPHGEKEAKKFDRLQESKEYLQELLKVTHG